MTIHELIPDIKKEAVVLNKFSTTASKIKLSGIINTKDSLRYCLKIPSSTNKDIMYDTIVEFLNTNNKSKVEDFLNTSLKFYSNAPSFVFNYANLFYEKDLMISGMKRMVGHKAVNNEALVKNPNKKVELDITLKLSIMYIFNNKNTLLNTSTLTFISNLSKDNNKIIADIEKFSDKMESIQISKLAPKKEALSVSNIISNISKIRHKNGSSVIKPKNAISYKKPIKPKKSLKAIPTKKSLKTIQAKKSTKG